MRLLRPHRPHSGLGSGDGTDELGASCGTRGSLLHGAPPEPEHTTDRKTEGDQPPGPEGDVDKKSTQQSWVCVRRCEHTRAVSALDQRAECEDDCRCNQHDNTCCPRPTAGNGGVTRALHAVNSTSLYRTIRLNCRGDGNATSPALGLVCRQYCGACGTLSYVRHRTTVGTCAAIRRILRVARATHPDRNRGASRHLALPPQRRLIEDIDR